jgi:HK97 family phage prohead protease
LHFGKPFTQMEKSAGIPIEFKDLDTSKRTAVIKHAVYTSIDKVGDISTKGMFKKSWNEGKPDFLFNHMEGSTVGSVKNVYDDDSGAYTEVKFGNWTLGNDVLEMASEGVIKGASFGYISDKNKSEFLTVKGQKIRKLKEVKHLETSLLTVLPAHPEAGIVLLNKSLEDISEDDINELIIWGGEHITSLKSYVQKIDAYCRKAKASDETITTLQNSLTEYKKLISDYDTAITRIANEPVASDEETKTITNFLNSLKMQSWNQKHLNSSFLT